MLLPKNDRAHAARRFVEANDRRVLKSNESTRQAHDAAWRALLEACDGDVTLANNTAAQALRTPRVWS
jgi:hypothetical protein